MNELSEETVAHLAAQASYPSVSIFMPTHLAGGETRQDPIRLKNLLGKAQVLLESRGLRSPEAKSLLEPGRKLISDSRFWSFQNQGLALFLSPGTFQYRSVPLDLDEQVEIDGRFHIAPLLPALTMNREFFVLALSQKIVSLWSCTKASMYEVSAEALPRNMAEALRLDRQEKQMQFHPGAPSRSGRRYSVRHCHGAGSDNSRDSQIFSFFRLVDAGVQTVLKGTKAPLLLIGVNYLLHRYRKINTCTSLLDEAIIGNPNAFSHTDALRQAWKIIERSDQTGEHTEGIGLFRRGRGMMPAPAEASRQDAP